RRAGDGLGHDGAGACAARRPRRAVARHPGRQHRGRLPRPPYCTLVRPHPEAVMPTWTLPLDRPHRIAGRAGGYVFVGGAGDPAASGSTRHPGDLAAQIGGAVENIAAALDAEGCTLADVVRLKAFFTGDDADEWAVLAALANAVGGDPPPAITTNP